MDQLIKINGLFIRNNRLISKNNGLIIFSPKFNLGSNKVILNNKTSTHSLNLNYTLESEFDSLHVESQNLLSI